MAQDPTPLTEAEKARRRKIWDRANSSVRMEGGIIDAEMERLQQRHIDGELTIAEVREAALSQAPSRTR